MTMARPFARIRAGDNPTESYRTLLDALEVQHENTIYWHRRFEGARRIIAVQTWIIAVTVMALAVDLIVR